MSNIGSIYYKNHVNGRQSLPYVILEPNLTARHRLFKLFEDEGFQQVAKYSSTNFIYVNFTLKRYAQYYNQYCLMSHIGDYMDTGTFLKRIWLPYKTDEDYRERLENNYCENEEKELRNAAAEYAVNAARNGEDFEELVNHLRWSYDNFLRKHGYCVDEFKGVR